VKNYRSIQCTEFVTERLINARSKINYFEHNSPKKTYSEKKMAEEHGTWSTVKYAIMF